MGKLPQKTSLGQLIIRRADDGYFLVHALVVALMHCECKVIAMTELTIFYDGGCSLCVSKMSHLCRFDSKKITSQDIHAEGFTQSFPHIDHVHADQMLPG